MNEQTYSRGSIHKTTLSMMRPIKLRVTMVVALTLLILLSSLQLYAATKPFGSVASEFNGFIFGDVTHPGGDAEGAMAIGGNADLDFYGVGNLLDPGGNSLGYGLVVGGDLLASNGQSYHGDVHVGGVLALAPTFSILDGTLFHPSSPIDFIAEKTYLLDLSAYWASLPSTTGTSVTLQTWGGLELNGTDPTQNIFNVTMAQFLGAGQINLNVPLSSSVLINVQGVVSDTIPGGIHPFWGDMFFNNVSGDATMWQRTVWNFPDLQTLNISNFGWKGSMLAPKADITYANGNIEGTLIANSLINAGSAELHLYLFLGDLPVPDPGDPTGDILGFKFEDVNQNGIQDPGEPPLEGIEMVLFTAADVFIGVQLTDVSGNFAFGPLDPGAYYIVENSSYTITTENNDGEVAVTVTEDAVAEVVIGNYTQPVVQPGSISGFKFYDANANGVEDAGELPLENITFSLYTEAGDPLGSQVTDADGLFSFADLEPGVYHLVELGTDYTITTAVDTNGNTVATVTEGNDTRVVIGNYLEPVVTYGAIYGTKFDDVNLDGILDTDESGLGNIIFSLYTEDGVFVDDTASNNDGSFWFTDLVAGNYYIVEDSSYPITTTVNAEGNTEVTVTEGSDTVVEIGNDLNIIDRTAELTIDKVVDFNGDGIFNESEGFYLGEVATWQIVVSNTGDLPLTDITVSDSNGASFGPFDLDVAMEQVIEYTTIVTEDTLNTASASGLDSWGEIVDSGDDDAAVHIFYNMETAWAYDKDSFTTFTDLNPKIKRWGWSNGPYSDGTYVVMDIYAGAGRNDISKGTRVGTLTVSYNSGEVTVVYEVDPEYYMTEAHLYVGNDPLLRDKKGKYTVSPGQFELSDSSDGLSYTFTLTGVSGDIYIAAHAVAAVPAVP